MKIIRYFVEFISILSLFCIFKIIGLSNASNLGSVLGKYIGPFFRSKNIIKKNIKIGLGNIDNNQIKKIMDGMWFNIGRTIAEYVFLKEFRQDKKNINYIKINGLNYLEQIKKKGETCNFFLWTFRKYRTYKNAIN